MRKGLLILAFFTGVIGCNNNTTDKIENPAESTSRGYINISVDESFQPVIAEQLKVFHQSFPDAKINAEYKPEAECLRDLQEDSTRMVIISRGLTAMEQKQYKEKLTYNPPFAVMAKDAVALIVNKNSPDSVFTLKEIKELINGTSLKKLNVVVDGNSATSTVRYLMDSLLKGKPLGKNVTGAKNSEDLIKYISENENAIGFAGISWFTNAPNAMVESMLSNVRLGLLECENCDKGTFAKPSQQTITFRQYPLVRGLYYVLKENYSGLGSGFVNFLTLERGQLIFRRADLVPAQMHLGRRNIILSE